MRKLAALSVVLASVSLAMAQPGIPNDATLPGEGPIVVPPLPADPVATPGEAAGFLSHYWQIGGWPLSLAVLGIALSVAAVMLRPKDEDGDGKPDPKGWRGYIWIASTALLFPLVPLLDRAAGLLGSSWSAVGAGLAAGVSLAWGYVWGMRAPKKAPSA